MDNAIMNLTQNRIIAALESYNHSVLYIIDEIGNIIYITSSIEKLLGFTTAQFYEPGFWESLVHPDDKVIVTDFYTRIADTNEYKISVRLQRADNTYLLISNTGSIQRHDGVILGTIGNLKALTTSADILRKKIQDNNQLFNEQLGTLDNYIADFTEHTKGIISINDSQNKLIESEQKYKYVVEHVTDVIFHTDNDGYWTYLNKAWTNIMEYEVEESLGTLFFSYLHPEDVEKNQILFTPLINREKPYCTHEIRYITKSGEIKWIRVYATLLINNEGAITGTTGTLKDITLEKQNSYRYELLSNNINDLVCLHETDGTYLYVSPSIKQMVGYDSIELIGKSAYDYFHKDDIEYIRNNHTAIDDEQNKEAYTTYRFKNKSGGYNWFETNTKMFFDEFYGRKLLTTSSRIIDERKITEQQILSALNKEKQLNEMKSKFVSIASHEFRTPMTAIKSGAEIAEMYLNQFTDPKIIKARTFINNIDEEIDRLSLLIDEILLLGKIESEAFIIDKQEVDLVSLISECTERQNKLQEDNRTIELKITGTNTRVYSDKNYLNHIVDNLISNAFKYSVGKQAPEIQLNYKANEFELVITDFGIGIPENEQALLFTSFYRATNASAIKGTGIGLVLVQNFVTMLKGKTYFESKMNEGTKFTISIPTNY